jgi:transcriptional regulator with XRE-family HTH domain
MTMQTPREWREAHGETLRDLAQRLGISSTSLFRYERGEREWPLSLAGKLKKISRGALSFESFLPSRRRAA